MKNVERDHYYYVFVLVAEVLVLLLAVATNVYNYSIIMY